MQKITSNPTENKQNDNYPMPRWIPSLNGVIGINKRLQSHFPSAEIESLKEKLSITQFNTLPETIKQKLQNDTIPVLLNLLKCNKYNMEMLLDGYIKFHGTKIDLRGTIPTVIGYEINRFADIKWIDEGLQINAREILLTLAKTSNEATKIIVDQGCIPILLNGVTDEASPAIQCTSINCLGYIAEIYGKLIIKTEFMRKIFSISNSIQIQHALNNKTNLKILQSIATSLVKVSTNKTLTLPFQLDAIHIITNLKDYENDELTYNWLQTIKNLTNINTKVVSPSDSRLILNTVFSTHIVQKCLDFIPSTFSANEIDIEAIQRSLDIVDNIEYYGTNTQCRRLRELGILSKLKCILNHIPGPPFILSQALLILSNIATGDHHQIQQIIDNGLTKIVLQSLRSSSNTVAGEAISVLFNMIDHGNAGFYCTEEQLDYMMSINLMIFVIEFIKNCDIEDHLLIALRLIERLFEYGWWYEKDEASDYCALFINEGGVHVVVSKHCSIKKNGIATKVVKEMERIMYNWFKIKLSNDDKEVNNQIMIVDD